MPFRPVSVGVGVTQICGYNANRTSLTMWNNGTETIFISNDQSLTVSNGFPVIAGGGVAFQEVQGDEPWMPLYAVSQTTNNDVRVVEQFGKSGGD